PTLTEYVRIPAKSPMFDPDWKAHGHLDRAVSTIEQWSRARAIEGLRVEVVRLEGRTPIIVMEVPGRGADTVLLYGHCDKQPEMVGWSEGLGLWTPTSLRGVVNGVLTVEVLTEGVHSGAASGIVPSSFRILRALLSRVEDERTGEILLRDLHADIPRERIEQARAVSGMLAKRL